MPNQSASPSTSGSISLHGSELPRIFRTQEDQGVLDRVNTVLRSGVQLDPNGLVLPHLNRNELRAKICDSLSELRSLILNDLSEGKTVVYLPGAFDLVHVGHASYIEQAVELFAKNSGLDRSQLKVVVLADSDELIAASKLFTNYPPGAPHRPVQNQLVIQGNFGEDLPFNPRLIDLACCNVDYVAMAPSPNEANELMKDKLFTAWLKSNASFKDEGALTTLTGLADALLTKVRAAVSGYEEMIGALKSGSFGDVQASFIAKKQGHSQAPEEVRWSLPSWQLMIHRFMSSVPVLHPKAGYFRVVSKHDVYSTEVVALMRLAGLGVRCAEIDDKHVISTTDIINQVGASGLLRAKVEGLRYLMS